MASEVRVNTITNRSGLSTVTFGAYGVEFVGITTVEQLNLSSAITNINATGVSTFAGNIDLNADLDVDGHTELDGVNIAGVLTATSANFSGNVTVLGDLTYENVTNQDSIGIATARSGLRITGGGLDVVGVSTFNDNVKLLDNDKLLLGTGEDLEIYHDGVDNYLDNILGNLYIRNLSDNQDIVLATDGGTGNVITYLRCDGSNGQVDLYHYGSTKINTTSSGINVTGTVTCDGLTSDGYATFNGGGEFNNGDVVLNGAIVGRLVRWDQSENALEFEDNTLLRLGSSNDLQISHDGSNSYISHDNTGSLLIDQNRDDGATFIRSDNGSGALTNYFQANGADGSVYLYHYGSEKLKTLSTGINVTGTVNCDGLSVNGAPIFEGAAGVLTLKDNDGSGGSTTSYVEGKDSSNTSVWYVGHGSSGDNALYVSNQVAGDINFRTAAGTKLILQNAGHLVPSSNGNYDLGTSSLRWRGLYANAIYGGSQAYTVGYTPSNGDIILNNGVADTPGIHFYYGNNTNFGIDANTTSGMRFVRNLDESGGVVLASFDTSGHFIPGTNNTYNLGSSSVRWANIYTNDLNLSNEGSTNDVDGTWGNYTIQEGEDDLFLINRRSGKKYKFMLQEVN